MDRRNGVTLKSEDLEEYLTPKGYTKFTREYRFEFLNP